LPLHPVTLAGTPGRHRDASLRWRILRPDTAGAFSCLSDSLQGYRVSTGGTRHIGPFSVTVKLLAVGGETIGHAGEQRIAPGGPAVVRGGSADLRKGGYRARSSVTSIRSYRERSSTPSWGRTKTERTEKATLLVWRFHLSNLSIEVLRSIHTARYLHHG
jgi:hypothetical protein